MSRSNIFQSIQQATQSIPAEAKTPLQDWKPSDLQSAFTPQDQADLWEVFKDRFITVNGKVIEDTSKFQGVLQSEPGSKLYVDPLVFQSIQPLAEGMNLEICQTFDVDHVDDYPISVTLAAGIIAETGTVIIKEKQTSSRLSALAPWTHITLVDERTAVYATLLDAISDLADDPYVVFITGPSKTADVEGILIEGVHGPGEQICLRI